MKTPGRTITHCDDTQKLASRKLEMAIWHQDQAEGLMREAMDLIRPAGDDPSTLARIRNGEYAVEVKA